MDTIEEVLARPKEPEMVTGAQSASRYLGRKRFQRFSPSASRNIATETATMFRSKPSAFMTADRRFHGDALGFVVVS